MGKQENEKDENWGEFHSQAALSQWKGRSPGIQVEHVLLLLASQDFSSQSLNVDSP